MLFRERKQPLAKFLNILIVALFLSNASAFANDHSEHDHSAMSEEQLRLHAKTHNPSAESFEKCQKLKNSSKVFDSFKTASLYFCLEYAYHNILDFYETALHFAYRINRVLPTEHDVITSIIYWEWSRYLDHFNRLNGAGKNGLRNSAQLVERSLSFRENRENPEFHWELAKVLFPIARYYDVEKKTRVLRPEFLDLLEDRLLDLNSLAQATDYYRIRARTSLGHINRYRGNVEAANSWYSEALRIDPNHRTAIVHMASLSN